MIREPCRCMWHGRCIVARELSIVDELLEANVIVVLRVASMKNLSVEMGCQSSKCTHRNDIVSF